jgi:hypothetical protein
MACIEMPARCHAGPLTAFTASQAEHAEHRTAGSGSPGILSLSDFLAAHRGRPAADHPFGGLPSPQLESQAPCLTPRAASVGTPTRHFSPQDFLGYRAAPSPLSSSNARLAANESAVPLVFDGHDSARTSGGSSPQRGRAGASAAGQLPSPAAASKPERPSGSKRQRSQPGLPPPSPHIRADQAPVLGSFAAAPAMAARISFEGRQTAVKPPASPPMPALNPAAWRSLLRPVMVGVFGSYYPLHLNSQVPYGQHPIFSRRWWVCSLSDCQL